jgi:hypothetical protein
MEPESSTLTPADTALLWWNTLPSVEEPEDDDAPAVEHPKR